MGMEQPQQAPFIFTLTGGKSVGYLSETLPPVRPLRVLALLPPVSLMSAITGSEFWLMATMILRKATKATTATHAILQ